MDDVGASYSSFNLHYEEKKTRSKCYYISCFFLILLTVPVGLLLAAVIRAFTLENIEYVDSVTAERIWQHPNLSGKNFENLPEILAKTLSFPTVVSAEGDYDETVFRNQREYLEKTFSNVFTSNIVQIDESFPSFLLTVKGNSSDNSFLLLGHLDVVPAVSEFWHLDPFEGQWLNQSEEGGGYVSGRGAIDDKLSVVAILCAVDELLGSGWQPSSTFYVAFGHDEEVGGENGAKRLSSILASKGVSELFFILDEGMPIVDGILDGIDFPVATIGVTEKGWMDVKIEATGVAGHSSIPPHEQATHRLATALHNLHQSPQPLMIGHGPEGQLLRAIAPKSSWPKKLALSNPWLFRPLIGFVMSQQRETDALLRTTTATTIIRAGVKDNVVPGSAWALVNHRVHPGQTLEEVLEHDKKAVGGDNINVTLLGSKAPPLTSPHSTNSAAFCLLAATVNRFYPTSVVAPTSAMINSDITHMPNVTKGLMIANTDTRHYLNFSTNVYRFYPFLLTKEDVGSIHGHNERISATNVWTSARFYHSLILSAHLGLGRKEAVASTRKTGEL